jgi:hypothetical protein
MNGIKLFSATCLVLGMVAALGASASGTVMDSSAFDWKYEFEGAAANTPDNLDIDGNSSPDMMQWGSAGSVADGAMTLGSGASYIDDYGWKPALVNGIWRANTFSAANGFTIEARIHVVSDWGGGGATSIAAGPAPHASVPNAADGWLCIGGSSMRWTVNEAAFNSAVNSDDYHVFRLALNPATNAYDVWRDNVKVGSNLPDAYSPSYGGLDRLYLGDLSDFTAGETKWDYVRMTEGYFTPVLASGLAGLLAYAWRKRK